MPSSPTKPTVESSLSGTFVASPIRFMVYGRGTVESLPCLISKLGGSKALIITGNSLSTKTPVIREIEQILGSVHAGTFNRIGQHAPISAIREVTNFAKECGANILIAVGGGSPIDSAKVVAYEIHEQTGSWIPSIAIPTTLSVAETTQNAGFTTEEQNKVAVSHAELVPKAVVYDADLTLYTPMNLWTSTGIRALDHAVELLYHPLACEVPTKRLALEAIRDLFTYLPLSKQNPDDVDIRQRLLLAAYSSLFPFLYTGGVGLSHSIGHAVGATYNIPHGITSCLTLSSVIEYKAATEPDECIQISRILPYIGNARTGDAKEDSRTVSTLIADLINRLGHKSTLTQYKVSLGQEESIAEHALAGGRNHPEFKAVTEIVRALY